MPIDVLRIATLEAAAAVGAEEHLGSLEARKVADVVLLDENPLEDIRHATSIWRVILGGRVFASESGLREVAGSMSANGFAAEGRVSKPEAVVFFQAHVLFPEDR